MTKEDVLEMAKTTLFFLIVFTLLFIYFLNKDFADAPAFIYNQF